MDEAQEEFLIKLGNNERINLDGRDTAKAIKILWPELFED